MNRVLRRTRLKSMSSTFALAVTCSLALSACASPVAPSAKPANFYEAVRSDAERFWTRFFSSNGLTYTPVSKMQLFDGNVVTSACGRLEDTGPFYCGKDQGVYLDSEFMQTEIADFGDFGAAVVVAHEIGHHVQRLLRYDPPFTILKELHADCLAGAWMNDADDRDLLDVSDSQEAAGSLFDIGDRGTPWFYPDAHGSPQQRVDAFRLGFRSGALSCFN